MNKEKRRQEPSSTCSGESRPGSRRSEAARNLSRQVSCAMNKCMRRALQLDVGVSVGQETRLATVYRRGTVVWCARALQETLMLRLRRSGRISSAAPDESHSLELLVALHAEHWPGSKAVDTPPSFVTKLYAKARTFDSRRVVAASAPAARSLSTPIAR